MYERESLLAGCLDPVDRAVLAFARSHPRRCPDALTRPALGLSATAYYQRLLALLDRVEAVVAEPALVARLRAGGTRQAAGSGWRRVNRTGFAEHGGLGQGKAGSGAASCGPLLATLPTAGETGWATSRPGGAGASSARAATGSVRPESSQAE